MTAKPSADQLARIDAAYARLFDTLDSLEREQWQEPSLLPDWTRAHVVAHLNDNATCFAEALEGLAQGQNVPVYASDEARDAAIADGATKPGPELLAEGSEAQKRWRSVVSGLDEKAWAGEVERTPGGVAFPVAVIPMMREREIEIHHVDLDAGYTPEDWPEDFAARLLEALAYDMGERGDVTVIATDTGARHDVGAGGQEVRGTAARLAWWLARQDPAGLESDTQVPDLGPLTRRSR